MGKWTIQELSCPEPGCGFVAKNPNGLRGHLQFKHGILPASSGGRQRLEQRARLVTEPALEQRLSALEKRLGFAETDALEQLLNSYASVPITDSVKRISSSLATLEQEQQISAEAAKELKAVLAKVREQADRADHDYVVAAQSLFLVCAVLETHKHSPEDGTIVIDSEFLSREWKPVQGFVKSELSSKDIVRTIADLFERPGRPATLNQEASRRSSKGKEPSEPSIIQGKTTRKGWKYLEHLNLSVKQTEKE